MKRLLFLLNLFFFILVISPIKTSAQWMQTKESSDASVTAIVLKGTNLFAGVNGHGVFLLTNDSSSWTSVNNGLSDTSVMSLAVKDNYLFAGTRTSGVFRSSNNGTTWTPVNSGLTHTYIYTLLADSTNLFAGTEFGGVFLSTNNGTTWTPVNSGLTDNVVHSLAMSGKNLFAGTHDDGVFLSTNNGTNWTPVNSGLVDAWVLDLAIAGSNIFAGTNYYGVFRSTNNGTTWTPVNSGLTNTWVTTLVVSGTNLYAGTESGIFLSTNNGTRWFTVNSGWAGPNNICAMAVSGGYLFAGNQWGAIYRRPLSEMIAEIENQPIVSDTVHLQAQPGWQPVNNRNRSYQSLSFTDSLTGWYCGYLITGNYGPICKTTNGGVTWEEKSYSFSPMRKILFINQIGFCCGDAGGIIKINNAGALLSSIQLDATQDYRSIFFFNSQLGWVCGGRILVKTTDGGDTWVSQEITNANSDFTDIAFGTSQHGFAVSGGGGDNYETNDGGLTWTSISKLSVDGLYAGGNRIKFLTPSQVIIGGENGIIVSSDNGATWSRRWGHSPQNCTINDLSFIDNKYGWAVGRFYNGVADQGVVLRTRDGGQSWESQIVEGSSDIFISVNCIDSIHAWIGSSTALYRTVNGGIFNIRPPTLRLPINNGINQSINPQFLWDSVLTAKAYHLQIAFDSLFTSLFYDDSNLVSTSKLLTNLSFNTEYYWRISAFDGNNKSAWSSPWKFRTTTSIVSLISPANGAQNISLNPRLQWDTITDASEYHLQVSRDSTFVNSITVDTVVATNSITTNRLQDATIYYWRVSAKLNNSYYPWSKPWSLSTRSQATIDPLAMYFPLQIGNIWKYSEGSHYGGDRTMYYNDVTAIIRRDTIINGNRYSIIEYSGIVNLNPGLWPALIVARFDSNTGNYYQYNLSLSQDILSDSTYCPVPSTYYWGTLSIINSKTILGVNTSSRIVDINYDTEERARGFGIVASSRISFREFTSMQLTYAKINGVEYATNTSIKSNMHDIPTKYSLYQNYPNPFNPTTTLSFALPLESFVSLKVYDVMGREVATIVSEELSPGTYIRQWNAANMSNGIYFYRLNAGSFTNTKKLILLK
jgi:photosystem II stability/assembly factor-like uncharacterized protein